MLQGDAIREITLEGPGAGGIETASAVIADITSVIGTMGTGFLQNDAAWRQLERLPPGDVALAVSTSASRSRTGRARSRRSPRSSPQREISIARLLQHAERRTVPRSTSSRTRRGPAPSRMRSRQSEQLPRDQAPLDAAAGHLGSRRDGARMGVRGRLAGSRSARARRRSSAAPRLSERLGLDLHLKVEGANPTGSFKDRGMVVAVERAVEAGAHTVVCASTGNTAASAATYAARAGLRAVVLTPAGGTASAKRAQASAAGARVIEIHGSFDDALGLAFELCERDGFVLVNSASPDRNRIDGQKLVGGRDRSSSSARCRM